ncbi:Nuclease SbcCD subunit C [Folsomia candida]|uniref:Nuclease SbcCD subunit C n=1 Tax=Folsomia candida TaxID=158441 RepID=A0A226D7M1_FOLCA|nr:Nuclease SbcCD subunit C [Folsomia candida]
MPADDRPKRTTAGQPMERFGEFVPSDQRKPPTRKNSRKSDRHEVTLQDIEKSAAAGSRASDKSGSSRSATMTVKKQVIATTAKQDIAKLEIDINNESSTMKIRELEFKNLEKKVVTLMEQLSKLDGQSEEAQPLKRELEKMTSEMMTEDLELNKLKVRLDNKKANLQHSKQLIQNVAELKKLELDQEEIEEEETASQKLSDDDFNTVVKKTTLNQKRATTTTNRK